MRRQSFQLLLLATKLHVPRPSRVRGPMTELPRALGVSSVWAMDVLERLRVGQPNLAKVEEIACAGVIPIDLARDDKKPELQLPPHHSG